MDKKYAETTQQIDSLQNCCRTCGNSTEDLISIFNDKGLGYELNVKISTYLHIQVKDTDTLPLNICIKCTTTLLSFHELYLCCLKAKEDYENILNQKHSLLADQDALRKCFAKIEGRQNMSINDTEHTDHHMIVDNADSSKMSEIVYSNLQQKLSCQYCTDEFQSKNDLIDHLKDIHTDLIFLCDVCKGYLPRNDLLAHMTSHAISLEQSHLKRKKIQCEKCNKIFQTNTEYQQHFKIAHQKQTKLFQCLDCDKTFKTNRVLRNHINHKHSNKREYKCDQCPKSFKTDSGLYAHRKTHIDNYDYSCQICFRKFKFKVHLSRHMTMHSNEKSYFCRFCSKSFGVKDNLNKHLKTHVKLFEFKCHICDFITSQRRYLAMHMKTSHLIKKCSTLYRQSCNEKTDGDE